MNSLRIRGVSASLLLGALACFLVAGCGVSKGDVAGKVTYKGSPLKGGIVTFTGPTGSFTGSINEDGTYTVHGVHGGTYKVTVDTEFLKPRSLGGAIPPGAPGSKGGPPKGAVMDPVTAVKSGKVKTGPPPGGSEEPAEVSAARGKDGLAVMVENAKKYVEIPKAYASPDSTDLTFTATSGSQSYDIDLKQK